MGVRCVPGAELRMADTSSHSVLTGTVSDAQGYGPRFRDMETETQIV